MEDECEKCVFDTPECSHICTKYECAMKTKILDVFISTAERTIYELEIKLKEAKDKLKILKIQKAYAELKEKYPIGMTVYVQPNNEVQSYSEYEVCGYVKEDNFVALKGYVWSSKQGKHLKDMQHTIYPEAIIDSELGNN